MKIHVDTRRIELTEIANIHAITAQHENLYNAEYQVRLRTWMRDNQPG